MSWNRVKPNESTILLESILAIILIILWYCLTKHLNADQTYTNIKYIQLFFGGLCAFFASKKNRNPFIWGAWGLWFAFIPLFILPFLSRINYRLCPYCRESVKNEAIACPHCQRDIGSVFEERAEAQCLCPYCKKTVSIETKVCPHCQHYISNIPNGRTHYIQQNNYIRFAIQMLKWVLVFALVAMAAYRI